MSHLLRQNSALREHCITALCHAILPQRRLISVVFPHSSVTLTRRLQVRTLGWGADAVQLDGH